MIYYIKNNKSYTPIKILLQLIKSTSYGYSKYEDLIQGIYKFLNYEIGRKSNIFINFTDYELHQRFRYINIKFPKLIKKIHKEIIDLDDSEYKILDYLKLLK